MRKSSPLPINISKGKRKKERKKELINSFSDFGKQEDAVEAYQKILEKMHFLLVNGSFFLSFFLCLVELIKAIDKEPSEERKKEEICFCLIHRNFASYSFSGVQVRKKERKKERKNNFYYSAIRVLKIFY